MRNKAPTAAAAALVSALISALVMVPATSASAGPPIWTGYIDVAHQVSFKSVTADFKIPAVGCTSQNSKASFWIGLWGGGTIEQVGISTDCHAAEPDVEAWLEMYPLATRYEFKAFPGDSVAMAVTRNANGTYSLALKDQTRPSQKFNLNFACPSGDSCDDLQAGAILEAAGGTNLSRFSTAGFTEFQAVTNTGVKTGLAASGSAWGLAKTLMTGTNGQPLAALSSITGGGEDFSLTYKQAH